MSQSKPKHPKWMLVSHLVVLAAAVMVDVGYAAESGTGFGEPLEDEWESGTWVVAEEELTEATTHFVRKSATTFVQYDDDNTWVYEGAGCISRTGGSELFDVDLQIPDGVELDFLRIYFNDTDASNDAVAILWSFDGEGGLTEIARAESTGTPGRSSEGSGLFSHVVDNLNEALAVRISFGAAQTSALEICGVRVRYTTP